MREYNAWIVFACLALYAIFGTVIGIGAETGERVSIINTETELVLFLLPIIISLVVYSIWYGRSN